MLGQALKGLGEGAGALAKAYGKGMGEMMDGQVTPGSIGAAATVGGGLGFAGNQIMETQDPSTWTDEDWASLDGALNEAQQKEGRRFSPEESKEFFLKLGMSEAVSNQAVERKQRMLQNAG